MRSAKEKEKFRQLHAAYREAWHRFSSKVEFWRLLICMMQADSIAVGVAEHEVRLAELEYRTKRNQLAEFMLARSERSSLNSQPDAGCLVGQEFFQEHSPSL